MNSRLFRPLTGVAALVALAALAVQAPAAPTPKMFYVVKNLTSDGMTTPHTDANLVNGWGLAAAPGSPWWVANNGTDTSTLYLATGAPLGFLVVSVPGGPTGIVFNGGTHFVMTKGRKSAPAAFMFATEEGKIWGWSATVPGPIISKDAMVVVDSSVGGAVYKGLAIATGPGGDFIYAADFHNGRVDVFDGEFNLVTAVSAFTDPNLPEGYAPFGIQNVGGHIFVAYARQDANAHDEIAGAGFGFVDEFDAAGAFVARVASRGSLNAPWGIAMAPATGFGPFSGDLLIGNFGDGSVNVYGPGPTYTPMGPLKDRAGMPIVIDGLWGIAFGTGGAAGPKNVLYFAAGPEDEAHGLFGSIKFKQSRF